LSNHVIYLKRDGVTQDGADARMLMPVPTRPMSKPSPSAAGMTGTISASSITEDAAELQELRTFTRELMADAERDLGTRLDWVAVDHWNTDNPHVHVLIRGRGDDGKDLVISRAYISRDFAIAPPSGSPGARPPQRAGYPLGPGEGGRGRALDQPRPGLRDAATRAPVSPIFGPALPTKTQNCGGDVGRRLSSNGSALPNRWRQVLDAQPGIEVRYATSRSRGDIIKTMHQAMAGRGASRTMSGLHCRARIRPIRCSALVPWLHDELTGSAYAIVEGVDGDFTTSASLTSR